MMLEMPEHGAAPEPPLQREGGWEPPTSAATQQPTAAAVAADDLSEITREAGMDVDQLKDIIRYAFNRFDANGDRQLSFREFCMACTLLNLGIPEPLTEKLFLALAEGKDFISPDDMEENLEANVKDKFGSMVQSWYESGLGKGQYVLNSVMEAAKKEEEIPWQTRVRLGLEAVRGQGEVLTEFLEFLLTTVLLVGKLECFPNCEQVDITDLVPLLVMLWRSSNQMFTLMQDRTTVDLDEDYAAVFARVFKPAGFEVSAFLHLVRQTQAQWVSIRKGTELPVEVFEQEVVLIGRGRIRIRERSAVAPALTETTVELGAGSFLGTMASFENSGGSTSAKAPWHNERQYALITEDVRILRWDVEALAKFLQVDEEQQKHFQCAFSRSSVKTLALAREQSLKISRELPTFFRDSLLSFISHFQVDRASVWIHDREQKELWTLFVAEDGSTSYFSIGDDSGLAGHSFTKGTTVNVPDSYMDERFNAQVDKETGYRTKSVLCIPIVDEHGVEGVLQLLNKMDSPKDSRSGAAPRIVPFSDADVHKADECMWQTSLLVKQLRRRYTNPDRNLR